MGVTIRGIRVDGIDIRRNTESEAYKVDGNYSLISTADKVLAKQGFNGYSEVEIGLSGDTLKALNSLMDGIKKDVEMVLGLNGGE